MPWTPDAFRARHNKKASPSGAKKGASIANAILARTGDEGKALRIANAKLRDGKKKGAGRPVGMINRGD